MDTGIKIKKHRKPNTYSIVLSKDLKPYPQYTECYQELIGTFYYKKAELGNPTKDFPEIAYRSEGGSLPAKKELYLLDILEVGLAAISVELGGEEYIKTNETFEWTPKDEVSLVPCFTLRHKSNGNFVLFTTFDLLLTKSLLAEEHKKILEDSCKRFKSNDFIFIKSESCEWISGLNPDADADDDLYNQINLFAPGLTLLEDYILCNKKGYYNGKKLDFFTPPTKEFQALLQAL